MTDDYHLQRGCVQVYTGDGKGKTTAALGLAMRAAGAGLRVFIAQFLKHIDCSEIHALRRYADRIECKQYGCGGFIQGPPGNADIAAARDGLAEARAILAAGQHDVVILDEANVAVHFGLIDAEDLLAMIDARPEQVELVLTGRRADPRVIDRADLVTEMREVKHYYANGLASRKGIED